MYIAGRLWPTPGDYLWGLPRKIVGGYIGIVHGFTSIDTSTVGGAVISPRSRIAFGSAGMMYSNPFIACPRARACGARRKKERMLEISA